MIDLSDLIDLIIYKNKSFAEIIIILIYNQ